MIPEALASLPLNAGKGMHREIASAVLQGLPGASGEAFGVRNGLGPNCAFLIGANSRRLMKARI